MNLKFVCQTEDGQALSRAQFIDENVLILFLLLACLLWCLISIFLYIYFKFMVSFGGKGGYTISEISEDKEAGLNFFLTLILPLLIGDLNEWQNAATFVLLFIIIFILLMRTDLFYANPVLTLLGYHVYKVTFKDNPNIIGQCTIVATGEINKKSTIEYKKIAENVWFSKVIKQGGVKNATA